jgi:hypothetical protein
MTSPMMQSGPTGLDFAALALKAGRHPIVAPDGKRYELRDDFPSALMLRRYLLHSIEELVGKRQEELTAATQAGQTLTPDDMRSAYQRTWEEWAAEVLALTTALFQHSDTSVTAEEIAAAFTPEQQKVILDYFFTRRLLSSMQQRSASDASASAAEEAEPAEG